MSLKPEISKTGERDSISVKAESFNGPVNATVESNAIPRINHGSLLDSKRVFVIDPSAEDSVKLQQPGNASSFGSSINKFDKITRDETSKSTAFLL